MFYNDELIIMVCNDLIIKVKLFRHVSFCSMLIIMIHRVSIKKGDNSQCL